MAKHNNIEPTIGNFYHYHVVVEKLFELKQNEKLIIEVHGDLTKIRISDNIFLENIEIKHHKNFNELNPPNIDFWKTIKNWVENYTNYTDETSLILYTTSIPDKELNDFINKTKDEKLKLIISWKEKTTNEKILELFPKIFKSESILKSVLHKIKFDTEQKIYKDISNHIIDKYHSYFDTLDNHTIRTESIKYFIGEIIFALKDKENWEIDFEYFKKIKTDFIYKNKPESIKVEEDDLRDQENETNVYKYEIYDNPLYIKKLQEVKLSDAKIKIASRHKLRAFKFTNILRKNSFSFYDNKIKRCAETFTEKLEEIKSDFTYIEHDLDKNISNSNAVYDSAMNIDKLCLHDEDLTESFRKGYWHILADDEVQNIHWLIEDEK